MKFIKNDKGTVTEVVLTYEEYSELRESESKLCALENMGVDNWCGYGEAMSELYSENEEEDY